MTSGSELRQPELPVCRADFIDCDCTSILATIKSDGYSSLSDAFLSASRQAFKDDQKKRAKVFWLLSAACSMMLRSASTNEPFKPLFVIGGARSIISDDFQPDELTLFSEIVDAVDDPWLRARLADIVWMTSADRDFRFVLIAIDAYCALPLDLETWIGGGDHCWARAASLAKLMGSGAGDRLSKIEDAAVAALKGAGEADGFLALWLAELLASNGLGRPHRLDIAVKLEQIAFAFLHSGETHRTREYFRGSAQWYRRAESPEKSADRLIDVAESFASEAFSKANADAPINALAASLYEEAIQTYRKIPRALRTARRVEERITELRGHLKSSGALAIAEFVAFQTPGVNINEIVHQARSAVAGKSLMESLHAFAQLHSGAKVAKLRKQAIKGFDTFVMSRMFGHTLFGRDGRVVAKRPAFGAGGAATDEQAISAQMIRDHGLSIGLVAQGCILPALDVMRAEHTIKERDFVELASVSSIVPPNRALLIGKGLFAGYDHDFLVAIHLLTPQIEHLVRHHLQRVGVITAKLDADGIETEIGLSSLMALPEARKVLGEDIAFEIQALFCDPFGPNLRNEIAHGLLDDDECQSTYAVYAWWLTLKIVFNTYWSARQRSEASAPKPSSGPESRP